LQASDGVNHLESYKGVAGAVDRDAPEETLIQVGQMAGLVHYVGLARISQER
jgi:hypothetical protein